MKTRQEFRTIEDLVDLREAEFMMPNPEYQRGEVWTVDQQKKLIDSVMRGYQLPIIYLHDITRTIAGRVQERFEIIDGQQRINALRRFVAGEFPLYNVDDERAKFPTFLKSYECSWGGKDFNTLSGEHRTMFFGTELPVAYIETEDNNEVRDLFVRLQAGFPLNAQEKRDSFPGEFTDFILKLGGKPDRVGYPGHGFFQDVLRMKPNSDRGKTRQLAAQIAVLFFERHGNKSDYFSNINASAIDDYYYTNLSFEPSAPECIRLRDILDKLLSIFGNWKGPKLQAHNGIHLVLFLDSILDDYTRSWEGKLEAAQRDFSEMLAKATLSSKQGNAEEAWLQYGQWARTNSDRGESIQRRHRYYASKMVEFIGGLSPKDPKRTFNSFEREFIYWRDKGLCGVPYCGGPVEWSEAEIHHIIEHQDGGTTELTNGILVHKHCHPKGEAAKAMAKQLTP